MKIISMILLFTMYAFQVSAWDSGATAAQQTSLYYQISAGSVVAEPPEFGLSAGSTERQQAPGKTNILREQPGSPGVQFGYQRDQAIKMQPHNLPQIIAQLDDSDEQIDKLEENNDGQENVHEENISEQENNDDDAQASAQEENNDDVEEVFPDFSMQTAIGIFLGVIMATVTILAN